MKRYIFLCCISMYGFLIKPLNGSSEHASRTDPNAVSLTTIPQLSAHIVAILTTPSADTTDQGLQTRKFKLRIKSKTLSTILGGLAQSCLGVGIALTANDNNIKKAGLCNVLGSIFDTAAQLAAQESSQLVLDHSNMPMRTPTKEHEPITESVIHLTQEVLDDIEKNNTDLRSPTMLSPILKLIKKVPTLHERKLVMRIILSSKPYAKQFVNEVCDMLQTYIHERAGDMIELIKDKLRAFITNSAAIPEAHMPQPPQKHTESFPVPAPVTMPSYQEYIINNLAQRVIGDTVSIIKRSILSDSPAVNDLGSTTNDTPKNQPPMDMLLIAEGTQFIDMMHDMLIEHCG